MAAVVADSSPTQVEESFPLAAVHVRSAKVDIISGRDDIDGQGERCCIGIAPNRLLDVVAPLKPHLDGIAALEGCSRQPKAVDADADLAHVADASGCVRAGIECPSRMRCGRTPYATRLDPERPHGTDLGCDDAWSRPKPGSTFRDRDAGSCAATRDSHSKARHGVRPGAPFATTAVADFVARQVEPHHGVCSGPYEIAYGAVVAIDDPAIRPGHELRHGVAKVLDRQRSPIRLMKDAVEFQHWHIESRGELARQCRLP